jgi:hypothetical protein
MQRVIRLLPVVLVFVFGLGEGQTIRAQAGTERGVEAFVSAGPSWMWSDESYLGLGIVGGGGVAYRLGRLGLEFVVDHRRHGREFEGSDVLFESNATRVAGRALFHMGRAAAQPYVGGLLGFARIHHMTDFPDDCEFVEHRPVCRSRVRFTSTHNVRVIGAVAGVRVAVRDRWFVRPEFEMAFPEEGIMIGATVVIGRGW